MGPQIDFVDTSTFRTFLTQLGALESDASEIIHGVFVDIHPLWKRLQDFVRTTGMSTPTYAQLWMDEWSGGPSGPYDVADPVTLGLWATATQNDSKAKKPFITHVRVMPTTAENLALRRVVEAFAREQTFLVTVEDRPMAQLAATVNVDGGRQVTAVRPGTIGGCLKDQNGKHWGVTCGHVAQVVGGAVEIEINNQIYQGAASVRHSNFSTLPQQHSAGVCNPYVGQANVDVDAALLEFAGGFTALDSVHSVGKIDRIYDRTQLNSGSTVRMSGAVSGAHDYVIGGYGVTCKIQLPGTAHHFCFKDVFEFYQPSSAFVPARIAQAMTARPMHGDSGSWICFNHSGATYAYFGNLVAVQGANGIATFADSLQTWSSNSHRLTLDVL